MIGGISHFKRSAYRQHVVRGVDGVTHARTGLVLLRPVLGLRRRGRCLFFPLFLRAAEYLSNRRVECENANVYGRDTHWLVVRFLERLARSALRWASMDD